MFIVPNRFKFLVFILSLITAVFLFTNIIYSGKDYENKIVIYHTNDMHGNVRSEYEDGLLKKIGLDVIKSIKDGTPNCLLVDAGDALQGTALGKYSKGKDIINLMNITGYDGMTLGNHEFDYGKDSVKDCVKSANFPVVSANIIENDEIYLNGINNNNGCNFIKELCGKRIGFFGITTEETNRTTIPPNLENITFKDEILTTKEQVEYLKGQNVDLIVGMMHIGVEKTSKVTSRQIAEAVNDIDIIIDGHSHTKMTEKVNNTVINQTGAGSVNIGKIDVEFIKDKKVIDAHILSAEEIGNKFTYNKEVRDLYNTLYNKIAPNLEKVIGYTDKVLYGGMYSGKNISRFIETNLGDLICDAMVWNYNKNIKSSKYQDLPIVAFENGGAVRSKIDIGYIKIQDIVDVLPLDNRLTVQIITPKQLYQVLERGVGKLNYSDSFGGEFKGSFGGFPQISGIDIEVDLDKIGYNYNDNVGGERIVKLRLTNDERELDISRDDDKTQIVFLCNDYTIYEFPSVVNIPICEKGDYLSNILSDYIYERTAKNGGNIGAHLEGNRIKIYGLSEHFKDFNASVSIKGNIEINENTKILLDDVETKQFYINNNNEILFSGLIMGPHRVNIIDGEVVREAYLNNYIGVTENSIILSNDSEDNINSVINIINQITSLQDDDKNKLKSFLKASYGRLNSNEKRKVLNYYKIDLGMKFTDFSDISRKIFIIFCITVVSSYLCIKKARLDKIK